MAQLNFHINEDTQAKLAWLTENMDDTQAGVVRRLIQEAFDAKKPLIAEDRQYLRWIRSNRE